MTPVTTATLAWWWIPAVTAGATVLGALIAALVAIVTGWLSDRRKFEAEDRRQWDKEIRDLYLDVAKCVGRYRDLSLRTVYRDEADMESESPFFHEDKRLRFARGTAAIMRTWLPSTTR
jgi:hypothetical protein